MMVNVSKPAYDPKDAVRHVVHDYVSLVVSAIIRKRSFLNMRPKPATSSAPKAQSSV